MTKKTALRKVLDFLDCLDEERIAYQLAHVRDTIMVRVSVPGERWEIECFEDGEVEVERFISTGDIEGEQSLEALLAKHGARAGSAQS